jgi:hypothetical protein
MERIAIAAQIYAALIVRSTRDLAASVDSPLQREAIETIAAAALGLADVLIASDAKSRPASLATR